MFIYKEPCAYKTIQFSIEREFYRYLNKKPENIRNIVVAGAYHAYEIERMLPLYPNAHFHAFEAYPKHFSVLKLRYLNNFNVSVYSVALADKNEKMPFYELTLAGSGSLLKIEQNQDLKISNIIEVDSKRLDFFNIKEIDLLWCDVQGAELMVLKGTNLNEVKSLFLEVKTRDYINPKDKQHYQNACFLDELEEYLKGKFTLHSIGLDNMSHNGSGNSFWVKNTL
jgi:methyltransferase, FkbM family